MDVFVCPIYGGIPPSKVSVPVRRGPGRGVRQVPSGIHSEGATGWREMRVGW